MSKRGKRALACILAAAMTMSLAACAGGTSGQSGESTAAPAASGDSAATPAAAGEDITLDIWHIWPNAVEGEGASINKLVEIYAAEKPNIKIQQDSSDTESYKTKLKVAFTGGDLPDLFFTYGAGFSKPFVETGRILALDDKIGADVLDRLGEGTKDNFVYDGKLYGLPIKVWAGTFFCNMELFDKEGLTPPTTWDELIEVNKAFREKGYQPMCLGGKDAWHIAMYFDQIALRTVGLEGVNAAMNGQKKFNDPEFLDAAQRLVELVEVQSFNDGFAGLGAQEAQAEFFMSRIPMYFNGSWLTGDVQSETNSLTDKVVAKPFPAIPGAPGEKDYYTSGAIDGWSVSADGAHIDEAVEFLVALCEHMSIEGYRAGDGISVWENDVPDSELNPVLVQINENLESAKGYCLAWDTQLSGADIDTYLQALQQLAGGGMSPQEFVDHLQSNLSVAMK